MVWRDLGVNAGYWAEVHVIDSGMDGSYELARLRPGSYRICVDATQQSVGGCWSDAFGVADARDIAIGPGSRVVAIDFTLGTAGHIAGRLLLKSGAPPSQCYIQGYVQGSDTIWSYSVNGVGTYSDANGHYDLGGLRAGSYRVCFFCSDGTIDVSECYDNVSQLDAASTIPIQVVAGATTDGIDAVADKAGAVGPVTGYLSGKVTDVQGNPLKNVQISAYQRAQPAGSWSGVGGAATDALGRYEVAGLVPGTYHVCFYDSAQGDYVDSCFNRAAEVAQATDVVVNAGATTAGINTQLALAGHITGTLTGAGGSPLSGFQLAAETLNASDNTWQWAGAEYGLTGPGGNYDLGRLDTGTYRVCFFDYSGIYVQECYNDALSVDSAVDLAVTAGQTKGGIDAQLALAGHITGTVTSAGGSSLSGIQVQAQTWDASRTTWQWEGAVMTGAGGTYDLGGLGGGTYRVCFSDTNNGTYAQECYNDAISVDSAVDVVVTAGQTKAGINAQLALAGHITGAVTGAGGSPLEGIQVNWDVRSNTLQWGGAVATGSGGTYDIGGLRAGTYRVCFSDASRGTYAKECYNDALSIDRAVDLTVTAGQTTAGISAQLALAGHVTGTVTAAGSPVSGLTVQAQVWNAGTKFWDWVENTFTAVDGTYNLVLGAGIYRVCFGNWNSDSRYVTQCYISGSSQNGGTDVTVIVGQTVPNINAQLVSPAHITGTVTNSLGGAAAGIQVQAQTWNASANYWQWAGNTTTGPNGTYDLGGLGAGTYQACFYGWNPYVQQCSTGSAGVYVTNVTLAAGQTVAGINAVAVDALPPTVLSLQPTDGTSGVPVDQLIVVQFDRSMDGNCQVQLSDWFGGSNLTGQMTWSQTARLNDTLTFVPAAPLRYSMGYDLVVSRCHDTNGIAVGGYEWSVHHFFSTAGAPGDTSAPQLTSTAPYVGQVGGDASHILIVFDKPIDAATINSLSVSLNGASSYRLQPEGFDLNIWPQGLQAHSQYQVVLTTAVADAQGHPLAAPYTFSFNSGAGDTIAPTVVQTRPADQSPGLEWESIGVFFSESMNPDTISLTTVRVFDETSGGTQVGIHIYKDRVAEDGARAKIEIDRAFAEGGRWQRGHTYRVELAPTMTDLAGNPLASASVFRFAVASSPNTPPQMMGEGDILAYRQPDGRVTLDIAVIASSTTGGTLAVSVADLTQSGKVWSNLQQSGWQYVYTTLAGGNEGLNIGPHQLRITVTDPSNAQTRTLLRTIHVFDAVPVLTGGPADQATGVSLQPSFSFSTTGVTGAASYMLAIMDATSGDMIFLRPILPNAGTSYSLQVPPSQALAPNTAYRWSVSAFDSLGWPVGQALSLEHGFTTGSGGAPLNHTLTVNQTGTGAGTVGGGGTYGYNTQVTPTATAAAGSTFAGWSSTGCASAFALTANTTCTATFTLNAPAAIAITTGATPAAGVTVTCTPNPVPVGGASTCTATLNPGYLFNGWRGDCAGQVGAICTLTNITSARTVAATYVEWTQVLPSRGGWRATLGQ